MTFRQPAACRIAYSCQRVLVRIQQGSLSASKRSCSELGTGTIFVDLRLPPMSDCRP